MVGLKATYPELEIIVHDDACHLHKFAEARAACSAHVALIAPDSLLYVGDGFHMSGHTDPWCLAHCHPQAPHFVDRLKGARTSVCEVTFTWLGQYKHQTKHMSDTTFEWFLLEMLDAHNGFIAKGSTEHLPRACRPDDRA